MKGKVGTVGLLLAVAWALGIPPMVQAAGEGEKDRPRVQVALLLDTSGSMEGLVDQARHQLWKIVNEFSAARRNGEIPELQVALYEYGNSGLEAESGYIRQVAPLTDDLDRVSEALFQLTINGGSEHCGQVIGRAVKELAWSASNRDLKCIFIAGNEPFTQGPVDFRTACRDAAARNITVSTIYCGDRLEGINTLWAEGARLADGSYLSIDHNRQVVQRETPHDAELVRLSGELNETYVAYGRAEQRESAQQR